MAAKVVQCDRCKTELVVQTKFDFQAIHVARERGWLCDSWGARVRRDYCPRCKNG